MQPRTDILGGIPSVRCPYDFSKLPPDSSDSIHAPAVTLTNSVGALLCLFLAAYVLATNCNVRIFNRKIRHASVQNYDCALDAIRYAQDTPFATPSTTDTWLVSADIIDAWILLAARVCRISSLYCLSLALNQQRIYRSGGIYRLIQLVTATQEEYRSSTSADEQTALLRPLTCRVTSYPGSRTLLFHSVDDIFQQEDPEDIETEEEEDTIQASDSVGSCIKDWIYSLLLYTLQWKRFLTLSYVFHLTVLLLSVDPQRLIQPAPILPIKTTIIFTRSIHELTSNDSSAMRTFASFQQIFLLISMVCIIVTAVPPVNETHTRTRTSGPSSTSKQYLVASMIPLLVFWIDPSVVHAYTMSTSNPNLACVIPPWWWPDHPAQISRTMAVHGWASYMDLTLWISFLGVLFMFKFLKQEYMRSSQVSF